MKNELDERREKIERLIPDQGIRSILFDFDDQSSGFLSDRRKYIDYVKTTLSFFTLIAYKKFLLQTFFVIDKKGRTMHYDTPFLSYGRDVCNELPMHPYCGFITWPGFPATLSRIQVC